MMKRIFLYLIIFLVAFILTLAFTFPVGNYLSYYLSKYGFSYSYIEGNIFHIKIKDLEKRNFYIKSLNIKNWFYRIDISVDKNLSISVHPLSKAAYIVSNNFDISSMQKKPQVYGKLSGKYHLKIENKEIMISGEGDLTQFKTAFLPIDIDYIRHKFSKNEINATLKGKNLDGKFLGKIYLPLNIEKGYIKGKFSGSFMNSKLNQNIYIKFDRYIRW
ncbi:hypothetical protein [Persephonella sp. IF05-L8]|uniref:hypothetical protein n=1 Tax=Persephonella sp. IF05-L8 TaxID=1158338 RepID=UPI0004952165